MKSMSISLMKIMSGGYSMETITVILCAAALTAVVFATAITLVVLTVKLDTYLYNKIHGKE